MISTPKYYIVFWKDLDKWTIPKQLFSSTHFPKGWSLVRVGDIVQQATDKVKVAPDQEYKMVGIKWYGEGTFFRERVKGNSLSASYVTPLIPDAFIYNRLFAWKGSFAVVPEEHVDCYVSNEFPQFIVNKERILPRYLYLFFMCNSTINAVNKASIGSAAVSRNRFKEEDFLNFEIPLPPISIQHGIIDHWQNYRKEIGTINERIAQIIRSFDKELLKKLGIILPDAAPRKGAFTVELRNFERWDTFFYRQDFMQLEKQILAMNHAPLGEVLNFISMPWKKDDFQTGTFEYIEISAVTKNDGIKESRTVDLSNAPSRATTLIKEGDTIIATTRPYLGAFAIVPREYNNCVCSSGFALADKIKHSEIEKEFLLIFLKSPAGLRQMERRMTGGLYPAIVQEELEKILVPLLPLVMQRAIIQYSKEGIAEVSEIQGIAERKSQEIKAEIEFLILGTKQIKGI